jgi:hypothetical protein
MMNRTAGKTCASSPTLPPGRRIKSNFPLPARSRPQTSGPERLMLINAHLISQTPTTRHLSRQTREKVTRTRMALASRARQVSENRKQNLHTDINGYTLKVASLLQVIDINTVTVPPSGIAFIGSVTWRPHVGFGFITIRPIHGANDIAPFPNAALPPFDSYTDRPLIIRGYVSQGVLFQFGSTPCRRRRESVPEGFRCRGV